MVNFEKGKWYKSPKWNNFWIKYLEHSGAEIIVSERIDYGKLIVERKAYVSQLETYIQLTDLSEIDHFINVPINDFQIW